MRMRVAAIRTMSRCSSPTCALRAQVLVNERIRQRVDAPEAERSATRLATLVFDLDGMGMSHVSSRTLLQAFSRMSKLDTQHFPCIIGTIFVVNAPRIFSAAWAVISQFVHEGTQQKVVVYSWAARADAHAALLASCGEAALPRELGGSREKAPPYSYGQVA